ncbi:hypothetical protein NPJ88_000225 [Halomonas elongata]|uniref:hypothetical protein n=1 Tax=Halomonas elongata TaxID=2746 RepID=UPI00255B37E0|nr:hypothetical protein [Halomonas elongata]MDL4860748.1 hypothetical protein [Halomonas elongata]
MQPQQSYKDQKIIRINLVLLTTLGVMGVVAGAWGLWFSLTKLPNGFLKVLFPLMSILMIVGASCLLLMAWKDSSDFNHGKKPDRSVLPAIIFSIAVAAILATGLSKIIGDLSDKADELESNKAAQICELCSGFNEGAIPRGTEVYAYCVSNPSRIITQP